MKPKKINYKTKKLLSQTLEDLELNTPFFVAWEDFPQTTVRTACKYLRDTRGLLFKVSSVEDGAIVIREK